jgi:hypothetical protein
VRAPAPILVSTLHDPDCAFLPFIAATAPALAAYPRVVVAATAATDPRVVARLEELGALVVPGGLTGDGRRTALAAAGDGWEACFACDFDRWLHWAAAWPDELVALPARVDRLARRGVPPWYVCLGRTSRAFRTHPAAQRLPEAATNRALSLAAGQPLDAVSGAAWLSPEAAATVLAASIEPTAATDLEWPALILRHDPARLRGLRCEGLEWETPDFHPTAIAAAGGLAAWTAAAYDTPAVWAARLALAAASTAALARVLDEGVSPRSGGAAALRG